MARLICVTGLDGAGKNTLINQILSNSQNYTVADIWDAFKRKNEKAIFNSKKDIDAYLCSLSPDARLLFLAHALKFSIEQAISTSRGDILLNAYYYKYFATELCLGADRELVSNLIKLFPEPDLVFYLDIDVEDAARRKDKFSRYECGLVEKPDEVNFIKHQSKAKSEWRKFEQRKMIILNANDKPESLLKQVLKHIN